MLLLLDLSTNFCNKCSDMYQPDLVHFFTWPELTLIAALKNKKDNLELLIDTDMLLMAEKGIKSGICHTIYRYVKVNS